MEIRAGTSGYSFKEWKGCFYPEGLAAGEMLRFYGERLPTVEINNTFYRMPKESVLEGWAEEVPETFRFSIKASQRITHIKRLKGVEGDVEYLLRVLGALGRKLGVVLFQLPPNLKKDLPRLEGLLDLLGPAPAAFEFRHPSWEDAEVVDLLAARGVTLCVADSDEKPATELPQTAELGYLRLRREAYDDAALADWAKRVRGAGWKRAYVFFKHEDAGLGPRLAKRFLERTQGVALG